MTISHRA